MTARTATCVFSFTSVTFPGICQGCTRGKWNLSLSLSLFRAPRPLFTVRASVCVHIRLRARHWFFRYSVNWKNSEKNGRPSYLGMNFKPIIVIPECLFSERGGCLVFNFLMKFQIFTRGACNFWFSRFAIRGAVANARPSLSANVHLILVNDDMVRTRAIGSAFVMPH